jgi:hypothetical protein
MRSMITAAALSLLILLGCSSKYISNGALSAGFDTNGTYKIAIMPLAVRGLLTPSSFARDKAYDHLLRTLTQTQKFQPIDKYTVEQQVKLEEFGGEGGIDPVLSRKVGRKVGADLVVIAECVFEEEAPKVILNTSVEVLDVGTTMQVYSGSARTTNPASTIAAAEAGLEFATDVLVKKMR